MGQAELIYLKEVLGIESWIAPEGSPEGAPTAISPRVDLASRRGDDSYRFYVYTPFPLASEEREFIGKMLGAIGVHSAEYFAQSDSDAAAVTAAGYGLSFGVAAPQMSASIVWTELPSVARFLDGSDPRARDRAKREAWEKLKLIKSRIESGK